jgi:hypothetical protein
VLNPQYVFPVYIRIAIKKSGISEDACELFQMGFLEKVYDVLLEYGKDMSFSQELCGCRLVYLAILNKAAFSKKIKTTLAHVTDVRLRLKTGTLLDFPRGFISSPCDYDFTVQSWRLMTVVYMYHVTNYRFKKFQFNTKFAYYELLFYF